MTEQQLVNQIGKTKKVFIYGAGMVGSLVLKRLLCLGIEATRVVFTVTECNAGEYQGIPIVGVDELKKYDNYMVIISALKEIRKQMVAELTIRGIQNYLQVDEELFGDMEKHYVDEFLHQNIISTRNKDVLFMASDNNGSSGAFLCLVDLNRELNKQGISTLVVLPNYGSGEQLLVDNGIEYTYVLSKDWLIEIGENIVEDIRCQNEKAVQQIEQLIEKYHIKLVHNNTTYTYVGAIAALNKKLPFVWHIREYIREQGYWFRDEKNAYSLINKADYIITVSQYVTNCYDGLYRKKIQMIYDGVDIERYYWQHNILCEDVKQILMPGAMCSLKGQKQLIRAACLLKERGMKFRISFVGGGKSDYIASLKELVKKCGLEEEICFWGVSTAIEEWYRKADIVVVGSRSEAFGRVTVEGQLAGCLVIGARSGATVELVKEGETGLLYELDNFEMLAEKILYACENACEMQKIASYAQKKALNKYNKKKNAKKIAELYKILFGC